MSVEDKMALLRRYIEEVWNKGDLAVIGEIFPTHYISHPAYFEDSELKGPEGVTQLVTMYRAGFPDLRITIEDMFGDGDEVAARMTWYGTHRGNFLSVAPTGKQITFSWININRIADGNIVETWAAVDMMSALQQLGAIPPARTG